MPRNRARKAHAIIGRPKKADAARTQVIAFRLTPAEAFRLAGKAERSGLTLADYARLRALTGIARSRKKVPDTAPLFGEMTRAIFHEVRRQGVNLNQLAHHCNRHQVPPPPEIVALARELLALWQRLLKT
jgi:hypothetical protein